ncbi:hypothetical protein ACH4SP_09910 [Streptomyces sp. NPDC021093]|uniref:hypothetical protein n=1 Tax=Streptomyces sp. NPDC021093 TaxID=3365112 RepID=UPI0037BA73CC
MSGTPPQESPDSPGLLPPAAAATVTRIAVAVLGTLPAIFVRVTGAELAPGWALLVFGLGVLSSAVLLMWAAETARADISGSLALAILAFIAVLPEYAVDLYFAYTAGSRPEYGAYAAANMTGANRLLVGVGWPMVALAALVAARRWRKARGDDGRVSATVTLEPHRRIDVAFLAVAAVFSFVMPLTREIGWYVAAIAIPWYGYYLFRISRCSSADLEELQGVPARLALFPTVRRRLTTAGLFLGAAAVIFVCAEPFANSLITSGTRFGIDRFLLVQWVAPLASEAPELIVAVVFAWRLRASDGLGALLSSKVNQWTLLVGCLPLAHAIGGGGASLPLVTRQVDEVALTAAQTLLAVSVLLNLRFAPWQAAGLFALFAAQFALPDESSRMILMWVYLGLALVLTALNTGQLRPTFRAIAGHVPGDPHHSVRSAGS